MARPSLPPRRVKPWMIGGLAIVIVVVAAALSVKVVSLEDAAASAAGGFDPAEYAADRFESEVVPQIEDEAVDLTTLLGDLTGGADEADFGNTSGSSSAYSFPVTFTGVAGTPAGAILPVTVEGVPADVTVQVQIGPALNGAAIRDVTGTVSFNEFTNQLEYQTVATEFNNLVRETVLADVDPATLAGSTITVTGAFTRVNPALVSVVPVTLEVAP
jgi:predicted lipoprotein